MLAVALVLTFAATAQANPCGPHPTKFVAWTIVVIAALFLEVFVTTGFLLFSGLAVVPTFFALVLANAVSYLGIVLPLFAATGSVWSVEGAVIVAKTGLIKLLSMFGPFQADTFAGLKWRYALLSALAGNAGSYYVGTLLAASQIA